MRLSAVLLSVSLLTLTSNRLEASPIIFTNRAVFEAVVQPNALVTFDTLVGFDSSDPTNFCPVISIPVCGGTADGILDLGTSEVIGGVDWSGGHLTFSLAAAPFSYVDLNLAKPLTSFTAIGFDVLPRA
jgi:hypothetical protein